MNKKDIMNELIDRYEQLEQMKDIGANRIILKSYIRKLELKLILLLQGE